MGIKEDLLTIPMEDRFAYHVADNIFFINLENYYIKTSEEIRKMKEVVGRILEPIGKKVHAIANYDNFNVSHTSWTNTWRWSSMRQDSTRASPAIRPVHFSG